MPEETTPMKVDAVPCCPELDTEDRCDVLTFDYRLNHPVGDVNVEVIIRARLERCSGEDSRCTSAPAMPMSEQAWAMPTKIITMAIRPKSSESRSQPSTSSWTRSTRRSHPGSATRSPPPKAPRRQRSTIC